MNRLTLPIICISLGLSALAPAQDALPDFTPPSAQRQTDASTPAPLAAPSANAEMRGVAAPSKQVMLGAPLDGIIKSVPVEEAQTVKAGSVLARMDDAIQAIVVEAAALQVQARGEMKRIELVLEESRIMHQQMAQAHENGAASDWEVRRTKLQVDQAEAQLQALREQRELNESTHRLEQQRLQRHRLVAPFDGQVIRIRVEDGATVAAGDPVVSMVALDPLEAQIALPARLYGRLEAGRTYRLRADQPVNRVLEAKLKTVDPIIDSASRTFRCVFTIPNADQAMPAGFTVHLVWGE